MQALRDELAKRNISDTRDILLDFEQHFADGISTGLTEAEVCGKLGDLREIVDQYQDEAAEMNGCRAVEAFPSPVAPIAAATPIFTTAGVDNAAATTVTTTANTADVGGFGANDYNGAQGVAAGTNANTAGAVPNSGYNATNGTGNANAANNQQNQFNLGGLIGALCVDIFVLSWALPALASVIAAYCSLPIAFGVTGLGAVFSGIFSGVGEVISYVSPFGPMTDITFGIMLMALAALGVLLGIVIVRGFVNVIISVINWHARLIVGGNVVNHIGKKNAQAQERK